LQGPESTYKKQEVKTLSTGTPKIFFDFLRGVLALLQPTRPYGGFFDCVLGDRCDLRLNRVA